MKNLPINVILWFFLLGLVTWTGWSPSWFSAMYVAFGLMFAFMPFPVLNLNVPEKLAEPSWMLVSLCLPLTPLLDDTVIPKLTLLRAVLGNYFIAISFLLFTYPGVKKAAPHLGSLYTLANHPNVKKAGKGAWNAPHFRENRKKYFTALIPMFLPVLAWWYGYITMRSKFYFIAAIFILVVLNGPALLGTLGTGGKKHVKSLNNWLKSLGLARISTVFDETVPFRFCIMGGFPLCYVKRMSNAVWNAPYLILIFAAVFGWWQGYITIAMRLCQYLGLKYSAIVVVILVTALTAITGAAYEGMLGTRVKTHARSLNNWRKDLNLKNNFNTFNDWRKSLTLMRIFTAIAGIFSCGYDKRYPITFWLYNTNEHEPLQLTKGTYEGTLNWFGMHGRGTLKKSDDWIFRGTFSCNKMCSGFLKSNGDEHSGHWKNDWFKVSEMYETKSTLKNGDIYRGHWKNGKYEGKGKLQYYGDPKKMYDGDWVSGVREGEGTLTTWKANSKEIMSTYKGSWKNDQMHGNGEMEYGTGDVYSGEWRESKKHGYGKMKNQKNKTIYAGEWNDDVKHGMGKYTDEKGTYDGAFDHSKMHGMGTFKYANSDIYKGEWKDEKRDGKGKQKYANGDVYKGSWECDKRNGIGILEFFNGDLYSGAWKNNEKNGFGIFKSIEDGSTFKGYWESDQLKGPWIRRLADGAYEKGLWKCSEELEPIICTGANCKLSFYGKSVESEDIRTSCEITARHIKESNRVCAIWAAAMDMKEKDIPKDRKPKVGSQSEIKSKIIKKNENQILPQNLKGDEFYVKEQQHEDSLWSSALTSKHKDVDDLKSDFKQFWLKQNENTMGPAMRRIDEDNYQFDVNLACEIGEKYYLEHQEGKITDTIDDLREKHKLDIEWLHRYIKDLTDEENEFFDTGDALLLALFYKYKHDIGLEVCDSSNEPVSGLEVPETTIRIIQRPGTDEDDVHYDTLYLGSEVPKNVEVIPLEKYQKEYASQEKKTNKKTRVSFEDFPEIGVRKNAFAEFLFNSKNLND